MAATQMACSVSGLRSTGAVPRSIGSSSSSVRGARVQVSSNNSRLAMRRLVAIRAESKPASGGFTDEKGYAQTNAGGSGAGDPSSAANDVVEGVADKVMDAQKSAANLGSETQENLTNVAQEATAGLADLVDSSSDVVSKATESNPGH